MSVLLIPLIWSGTGIPSVFFFYTPTSGLQHLLHPLTHIIHFHYSSSFILHTPLFIITPYFIIHYSSLISILFPTFLSLFITDIHHFSYFLLFFLPQWVLFNISASIYSPLDMLQ